MNTNCLQGFRCECGSEGPFRIEVTTLATVCDDGTDIDGDTHWDEENYCKCCECDKEGKVADFQLGKGKP